MARDINLRATVTAKDDASKVLDDVAKKVKDLEGKDAKITVGADTKEAVRSIDDILEKVDKLAGTDSAKLVLTSNASEIATEIIDLVTELDKLDASDPKIDVIAGDIRTLEGDLERLSVKAKEIGDTPINLNTTSARQGIDDIGRSAGSSKSALANMIGNSAQDLGQLGGFAGSAGVAIGQLAEYASDAALEGEKMGSVMRNMAKVAGPIAALGVATAIVTSEQKKAAEAARINAEHIDSMYEALKGGAQDAVDVMVHLREEIEETGKLLATDLYGDQIDLVPKLAELGLTIEQYQQLIEGGTPKIEAWAAAQEAAGASSEDTIVIWDLARREAENLATAQERAAVTAQVLGGNTKSMGADTDQAKSAIEALTGAVEEGGSTFDGASSAMDALAGAVEEGGEAAETASEHFERLLGMLDMNDAVRDVEDGFADLQTAMVEAWTAGAEGSADAEEKARAARQAVDDLKREVIAYADEVGGIPPQTITEILTLIDQGKIDEARAAFDALSGSRTMQLFVENSAALAAIGAATAAATTPATMPVDGDTAALLAAEGAARSGIQETETMPVDGNTSALLAAEGAARGAVSKTATMPIDGNNDGAFGAINAAKGAAAAGATMPIRGEYQGTSGLPSVLRIAVQGIWGGVAGGAGADGAINRLGSRFPLAARMLSFARGGHLPRQATIQPPVPGGLINWAEPETGGESFIPHAPSKRQQALQVWEETGRILGAQPMANGGIVNPTTGSPTPPTISAADIASAVEAGVSRAVQRESRTILQAVQAGRR